MCVCSINIDSINRLPNLESLSISAPHITSPHPSVIRLTLSKLTRLAVFDLTREHVMFMEMLNAGYLKNLKSLTLSAHSGTLQWIPVMPGNSWNRGPLEHLALIGFSVFCSSFCSSFFVLFELDISHSRGLLGSLSELFLLGFPSLHTLILCDCNLTLQDLCGLIQSRAEGNLPKLRTLDVSHNSRLLAIMDSFTHEEPSKQCLYHIKSGQQFSDDPSKSLNYLQDLSISVRPRDEFTISKHWPRLEQLGIDFQMATNMQKIMQIIAEAYENSLLPSLREVLLFVEFEQPVRLEIERLNKHGIFVTIMKMVDKKFLRRFEGRFYPT